VSRGWRQPRRCFRLPETDRETSTDHRHHRPHQQSLSYNPNPLVISRELPTSVPEDPNNKPSPRRLRTPLGQDWPVNPGRTPWIESFNGRLRDEFLNGQLFDNLLEGRVLLEDWRIDYNLNRPHSAHGGLSPIEFVQAWLNQQQPALA
jgi:hypothetical protein